MLAKIDEKNNRKLFGDRHEQTVTDKVRFYTLQNRPFFGFCLTRDTILYMLSVVNYSYLSYPFSFSLVEGHRSRHWTLLVQTLAGRVKSCQEIPPS